MVDFASARRAMVDSQVSPAGVVDERLLSAMNRIPRERFVPEHRRALAYIDDHQPLGNGRFIAAPAIFSRLIQLAAVQPSDEVLDVGSASGYSAAILADLAKSVTAVENDADLATQARSNLSALDIENVEIITDLPPSTQRFDLIVIEDALYSEPDDLLARLKPAGRLVAFSRTGPVGLATRYVAGRTGFTKETHFDATLPPMQARPEPAEFVF